MIKFTGKGVIGGGGRRSVWEVVHIFDARQVSCVGLRRCCHCKLLLLDLGVELPDDIFDHFFLVLSNLQDAQKSWVVILVNSKWQGRAVLFCRSTRFH
jgi:hypothetical protein